MIKNARCIAVVAVVLSLSFAGCAMSRSPAASAVAQTGTIGKVLAEIGASPAAAIVSDRVGPFFWAGVCFTVFGGLAFVLGMRGICWALFGVGVLITFTGVLIIQYPWVILATYLVTGAVILAEIVVSRRAARRLAAVESDKAKLERMAGVVVEEMERIPEGKAIKAGIRGRGAEVMATVRAVVDPIKRGLAERRKTEEGSG